MSTGAFGLLVLPCTNKRCTRCDSPLSNSLWKKQIIVFSQSRRQSQNNFQCVRCLLNSSGEKKHSPEDLDNFVLHQLQKPLGKINPRLKRMGQKCQRSYHNNCANSGNFCACKCHEVS